ncbi:hypothetical protein [Nonomuraea deserti]|uniref:hypothetical protein n=1 Tax=Nonomuraea deserti TaxID=1848322 RepID=UPI001C70503E|nr:hypothetical protein [Nonomuraea deserti]
MAVGADPRSSRSAGCPSPAAPRWRPAERLCARLAARYWDLDDPTRADDLAMMLAGDLIRVVIHPGTVHRYPN